MPELILIILLACASFILGSIFGALMLRREVLRNVKRRSMDYLDVPGLIDYAERDAEMTTDIYNRINQRRK